MFLFMTLFPEPLFCIFSRRFHGIQSTTLNFHSFPLIANYMGQKSIGRAMKRIQVNGERSSCAQRASLTGK